MDLTHIHTHLAKKIIHAPSYLIQASAICRNQEHLANLKQGFKDLNKLPNAYRNCSTSEKILEYISNNDENRLMRRYALIWDIKFSENLLSGQWSESYKYYVRTLKQIIEDLD